MSALQAALCTVAMSMCVLLLAVSLSMAAAYVTDEEEAHFILQCRDFAHRRGFRATLPAASAAVFCLSGTKTHGASRVPRQSRPPDMLFGSCGNLAVGEALSWIQPTRGRTAAIGATAKLRPRACLASFCNGAERRHALAGLSLATGRQRRGGHSGGCGRRALLQSGGGRSSCFLPVRALTLLCGSDMPSCR